MAKPKSAVKAPSREQGTLRRVRAHEADACFLGRIADACSGSRQASRRAEKRSRGIDGNQRRDDLHPPVSSAGRQELSAMVASGGLFPIRRAGGATAGVAAFRNIDRSGQAGLAARERIQPSLDMPQTHAALRPLAQRREQIPCAPRSDSPLSDLGQTAFPDCLTDTQIHPRFFPVCQWGRLCGASTCELLAFAFLWRL